MQTVNWRDKLSFDQTKMRKVNLFDTSRFFADVYCFEPGQAQTPHAHAGSDKVYVVLEGTAMIRVDDEERQLGPDHAVLAPGGSDHGVTNPGPDKLVLLVFMAPKP